ncbi:hypothetical protein SAMN05421664_2893 [Chryseobacterium soldanellicola]|uniref:Uncharacterized protein n=1 Tax=Chryseobacterium soldanellicola TaxID=311333 RepID=A0A1H1ECJ3_9FLAO|nr:hypothetical protein [Chryseobacterium soldanellicola]SDQ86531.1 hypothetical protein SAMN05421664_2893 [Chryseobacterium soldanellicola]
MKNFFSFFVIIFFPVFHAQELKNFVVPKGYTKIAETKGDLDKDGKDEIVLVFNTDKKVKSDFNNGYQREFFILKNNNGKLQIWRKNSTVIFASETGFYPEYNPIPDVKIKNGCIIISQKFNTNSRHTQAYIHTFRFQNGDFYLIGSVSTFDDTCEFNMLNEINFSTGKAIVNENYSSCDEEEKNIPKDYHKEFIHKLSSLVKMNNFTPGENSFKIPNSDKYFNY